MDKYTVDLDKVLNDFEYSELTDQSCSVAYASHTEASNQYLYSHPRHYEGTYDAQYPKTGSTAKHSINNVFHSLNEYLNTEVKTDLDRPNLSNITEIETNVPFLQSNSKDRTELPSIEDVFKKTREKFTENNRVCKIQFVDNFTELDKNAKQNQTNDVVPVVEIENVLNENISDTGNNVNNLTNETEVNTEITLEPDFDTNSHLMENPVESEPDEVKEETETVETEISDMEPQSPRPVGFDDLSDISDSEMENELAQLEQEYKERVDKHEFDNTDNASDNVLHNVPDNTLNNIPDDVPDDTLDDMDNAVIPETEQIESDKTDERTDSKLELETSDKDEMSLNNQINQSDKLSVRPNSLDIEANASIDLIGDPGSTPYNNVYVSDAIPSEKNTQTETGNSLSPTLSEVSTSENSDTATTDSCIDTSMEEPLAPTADPKDNADITHEWLGKMAPFWTPDSDALTCMHCNTKFTVVKRRHHCRACGLVLCSKCCHMKYKLEYMENTEARVCLKCYEVLSKDSSGSASPELHSSPQPGRLHPNNPMDYCSVVPPLQQVSNIPVAPPAVMVPVGVLKRKGSAKSRANKSVMFCDGIRPGCDLTELDYDFNYKNNVSSGSQRKTVNATAIKANKNIPKLDPNTNSLIPSKDGLPPTVHVLKTDITYSECLNNMNIVETLHNEQLTFALQRNLHVHVKIINMECCINKHAWCFSTEGMITVGQDEIVILLEVMDDENTLPKDIFLHLNNIYADAVKGTSITEMGLSIHNTSNFLESKNHAGFLYVKATFQCVQNVIIPKEPYLIGILIHRWESPWAKIFPLRLLLRLGAEYRYYPSPIISTRHRDSVYVEIGHTIINLLADFRNFSYTLPSVRGLTIHMEEKNTTVSIPVNGYNQVMKALNNSSDHILAFAANFSPAADSHLVCIQDVHGTNENTYTTHAINIHNKPRKVTGASFIVLNGALKSSSGLTAKSSIVEDGLMIQILPEQMVKLRASLRNMKDFKINCGCVNVQSDEFVNIAWVDNDVNFNVGVVSPIDNMSLTGVPSIRVHNGKDYVCNSGTKLIRWTEVFIIQSGEESKNQDPVDISKLSENISKATSQALVKYLDLLATNSFLKIGIRTTLHIDSVSYQAGSNTTKLPPIYMKSLDNELIPVLHKITTNNLGDSAIILELIFHILNV